MKKNKINTKRIMLWVFFIVYLVVLIKVIFFKYPPCVIYDLLKTRNESWSFRITNSNIIPMKTIWYYLSGNESTLISIKNILGNILAFTPLGFFVFKLFKMFRRPRNILIISFIISISFELIQLFTGIGCYDIDDVLLNVIGAVIGYFIGRLCTNNSNQYRGFIS
ncbi:VanZ family protein [Clostridium sp.]|uniref:VanZ family protein n=1 Tax=Clostridium sp. TaxID=1506 RepID=UPI003217337E